MNTTSSQLISIELKAQEMVANAQAKRDAILTGTKEKCAQMEQDTIERRTKRLSLLAEKEQTFAKEKIKELNAEDETRLRSLEQRFTEKKDSWVQGIYESIIGR